MSVATVPIVRLRVDLNVPQVNGDAAEGKAMMYVEARIGDEMIHSDTFDRRSSLSRRRFCQDVAEKVKSPDSAGDIEGLLLRIIDEQTRAPERRTNRLSQPKTVYDYIEAGHPGPGEV